MPAKVGYKKGKSLANFFLCLTDSLSSQFSTAEIKFSFPISSLINSKFSLNQILGFVPQKIFLFDV